ncbi:IS1634 family transposase [Dactylosporangium cerinum]|uniref:IS1634 family transposase n=1 Tax=Dactylosporangium cerinum TaxID=1434730 RepID=A0ABV9W2R1_9ACTN
MSRLLDPAAAAALATPADITLTDSRPMGGAYALDGLWRRLGIDTAIRDALAGKRVDDTRVERILFALTANRALKPSSKLAATDWIAHDVHIDGLSEVVDEACYRAMDALLGVETVVARQVYHQVADLLNLEVDLLFFDTTSTYFETGEADEPVARDEHGRVQPGAEPSDPVRDSGFRTHGRSKDHRADLPQVVVGMAVTREGIPVRVWSWPGNYSDSALIRQVKDDMRDWSLARVVWVADRGFTSAENRRYLQRAGGHYIIGEKLRSGSAEAKTALSRQGRYAQITASLQVKEVKLDDGGDRFVICFNPDEAERDAHVRGHLVVRLTDKITGSDALSATKRAELRGQISTQPGLNRFLRVTSAGLLRIDHAAIKAEARLDGKYLLRCSDPKLTPEDIALGYKQLLEVERGWRDMKSVLDLRPVCHRLEERIRAHVLLCWLALLLICGAETTTGRTWTKIRAELDRLHAITFTGPAGTFRQTTEPTKSQRDLFTALKLDPPKKIIELTANL